MKMKLKDIEPDLKIQVINILLTKRTTKYQVKQISFYYKAIKIRI